MLYPYFTFINDKSEMDCLCSRSVLALHELTERADCVLPVDNQVGTPPSPPLPHGLTDCLPIHQALMDICHKVTKTGRPGGGLVKAGSEITSGARGGEKPFDSMNNIVANLLINLTR